MKSFTPNDERIYIVMVDKGSVTQNNIESFVYSVHDNLREAEYVADRVNDARVQSIPKGIPREEISMPVWEVTFNFHKQILSIQKYRDYLYLTEARPENLVDTMTLPEPIINIYVFAVTPTEAESKASFIYNKSAYLIDTAILLGEKDRKYTIDML